MKHTPFILALLFVAASTQAQTANPFKSIGKEAQIVTLSGGRYEETFDANPLQRIGSVVIDTRTNTIVQMLDADSMSNAGADNSMASRWTSIDPLAAKYPSFSPYAFCANNPILYKDPDGRALILAGATVDVNSAMLRMGNATGNYFNVTQSAGMTMMSLNINATYQGMPSAQQQTAIQTLLPITSPSTPITSVDIVNNSRTVNTGNWEEGKIDIGDMAKFDNIENVSGLPNAVSGNGKILHEFEEQYLKQSMGITDYGIAHNAALKIENQYNGTTRHDAELQNGEWVNPSPAGQKIPTLI